MQKKVFNAASSEGQNKDRSLPKIGRIENRDDPWQNWDVWSVEAI